MSDIKNTKLEIVDYLPSKLKTDPKFDVRPFERHATAEAQKEAMEALELLADDIEANGQLDPVCISPDLVLICGHRRHRAVILLNQRRSALGQPLLKLHCRVDEGGDLIVKAISSNLQRKSMSPVDLAYCLHQLRTERGLLGRNGGIMTARLLHIKRYVVENSEKLMQSSKEIQNRLHDGTISTDTALLLMKTGIPAGELIKIFERSREIQEENQTVKVMQDVETKRKTTADATVEISRIGTAKRIQRPAVVQSLREYRTTKSAPRSIKTIPLTYPDFLKGLSAADTSNLPQQARRLIRYLVKEYAAGKSCQSELERQFFLAFADESPVSASPQPAVCYLR